MGDEVVLHLVGQELRRDDGAFRLPALGRVEHVLAVQSHVGLGDGHAIALEVEVLGHERKRLSAADTQPVQQLEQQERGVLVHDLAGERLVLVLGPELHLLCPLAAHPLHLAHGGWMAGCSSAPRG